MTSSAGLQIERRSDGALWTVRLATPKANILDLRMIQELKTVFDEAAEAADLKCVLLTAEGPHFSFGASVEEHLPGKFERLIPAFHGLLHSMLDSEVVCLAAVQGQCLGGGLELAAACTRIFAAPNSRLGQPEIALGVFAPAASVLLKERVGRGAAEDLCLSGRTVDVEEAQRIGLIDVIAEDPGGAAAVYAEEHLLPRSAASLRLAVRAVRTGLSKRVEEELATVEHLYTNELMSTHDAVEGLRAFVEKRSPRWRNG